MKWTPDCRIISQGPWLTARGKVRVEWSIRAGSGFGAEVNDNAVLNQNKRARLSGERHLLCMA